jgi:ADP-heptose:LPS heptosyltransferase
VTVASADRAWARAYVKRLGLRTSERLVVLHPGSRGSSANWTSERYGELARALRGLPRVRLLLTGSAAEQDQLQAAAQGCVPEPARLTESVSLPRFAALLAAAAVFVSGNTGPTHLASALGVPTVSVFPPSGVTGPARWHPLGRPHIVLTPPEGQDVLAISAAKAAAAVRVFLTAAHRGPRGRRAR